MWTIQKFYTYLKEQIFIGMGVDFVKGIRLVYVCSIIILVIAGLFFVKLNRSEKVAGIIENLKDKTIVIYSSNNKRLYINTNDSSVHNMDTLCIEGASFLRSGGFSPVHFKIENGDSDPYTLSSLYLKKNLKKNEEYVLIDLSRSQTRYGTKCMAAENTCCPISIILSKKSASYENSLLFASRVKWAVEEKYKTLTIKIVTAEDQDYNQDLGHIGMLVELGDSANSYDEARESLKVFCQAVIKVGNVE